MQKKTLLALPILLLVALSASGIALAKWSDNVQFTGTVTTATFSACIQDASTSDEKGTLDRMSDPDNCNNWQIVRLDKDIGMTTITKQNCTWATVSMENVYPGYYVDVRMNVFNTGTLPWNVTSVDFYYANGTYAGTLTSVGTVAFDFNGDGCTDVKLNYGDGFGIQVHNGGYVEISWLLKVMECAPQDSEFGFYFKINICAYNAIPE